MQTLKMPSNQTPDAWGTTAPPGPRRIWVESTDRCNTRCVHCQHYYSSFGQDMDQELFDKVVAEVLPGVELVVLNGYGEPFLARHFDAMFDTCAKGGAQLVLTSNGILLRDRERILRLARANAKLALSVDGACKATFESIRPFIKWEQMIETLANVRDVLRDPLVASRLSFCIHFCAMKRNIAELPDVVRLAHRHGAREVTILPLAGERVLPQLRGEFLNDSPELVSPAFMQAVPLAQRLGVTLRVPPVFRLLIREGAERRRGIVGKIRFCYRSAVMAYFSVRSYGLGMALRNKLRDILRRKGAVPFGRCRMPWEATYCCSDGTVYPCCFVGDCMGDLRNQSWDEIWNGRLYVSLRRTVHGWNPPRGCRICPEVAGILGGDQHRYDDFFARFRSQVIPIETLEDSCWDGFYDLEYHDGRPCHRWMRQSGQLSVPMRPGARFLRLRIDPCLDTAPGRCTINDGPAEYFDTSCDTITFPLDHVRGPQLQVKLEMDSVWNTGNDPRELGLPVRGVEYLF